MGVQKYDLIALKNEFIASDHTSVQSFLRSKGLAKKINTIKTVGWTKEKKEIKAKSAEKAIKQVGNKLAKQLEPSAEFLLGNITKAIELSGRKLEQMEEKDSINVKDLNTIRGMNRIQNGQPTTYVKEDQNVNQNVSIAGIHIVLGPDYIDNRESDKNNA